jgi:hypothetical protein
LIVATEDDDERIAEFESEEAARQAAIDIRVFRAWGYHIVAVP